MGGRNLTAAHNASGPENAALSFQFDHPDF